jgi:CHAD domain-containing protein
LRTQKQLSKELTRYAVKRLRKLNKTLRVVVTSKDAEAVHDLRKTTRELQSLVDACCINRTTHRAKRVRRGLRFWRHALSPWRDSDVMIKLVEQAQQKAHHVYEQETWAAVAERTAKQRSRASKRFLKGADFKQMSKLRSKTKALVKSQAKVQHMADNLGQLVQRGWHKLRDSIDEFKNVPEVPNLHAVRIKAKALRYALELRQKFYPDKELKDASVLLKDIQDQIGHWHDELMLTELVHSTLLESDSIADPKITKVIEGIKEREIKMAESARHYLLTLEDMEQYNHLRRLLSAAIYATSNDDDAKMAIDQSVTGPIH